jgi:DNA-binding transcriptional regulator YiaG
MERKTFVDQIKAARQAIGLSQAQAAKVWGFSLRTLQGWESGRRQPIKTFRHKLERILKRARKNKPVG